MDPTVPLKVALGPVEHPGCCRGMRLGARTSMVYGRRAASEAGTSRAGTSSVRRVREDNVGDIHMEVTAMA